MLLRDLLLGSENSRQKTTGNFVKFERETVYSAVTSRRPHITKSTGALPQNFFSLGSYHPRSMFSTILAEKLKPLLTHL